MRDYPLDMEKQGISKHRFRELQYFCQQYREKKRELAAMLHSSRGSQEVVVYCGPGDPTLRLVERRERLLKDCEDVEQSAIEAAGGGDERTMYQHLLNHVTGIKRVPIEFIPCGKNQFIEMRRRFFLALNERR